MSTPTEIRQMLDNVLQSGGGTEEIIAALMKAGGTRALFEDMPPPKRGRPRKHADDATKHRAFRARKRARNAIRDEMPTEEGRRIEKYVKAQFDRVAAESSRDEIRDDEEAHANAVIQALIEDGLARMEATKDTLRDEIRDEIPAPDLYARSIHLRRRLDQVAGGSFDPGADLEPIVALIRDQACDLEGDVLPIVARELPELGGVRRPLKNWGAPWLVREILAARDQRLAGQPVEAPPPARRAPAIEWDE